MGGRGFSLFREIYRDEGGQATTEYILLLSVTITGTVALARVILSTLDKGIFRFGAQLERDLKTGRAQLGTWEN